MPRTRSHTKKSTPPTVAARKKRGSAKAAPAAPAPVTTGRAKPGSRAAARSAPPVGARRLTDEEVVGIRHLYWVKHLPVAEICEEFELPQSTVYSAARGTSYRHVPMPDGALPTDSTVTRRTKYPQAIVDGIRAAARKHSKAEIGRMFGVSQPYVSAILSGKFRTSAGADSEPASLE